MSQLLLGLPSEGDVTERYNGPDNPPIDVNHRSRPAFHRNDVVGLVDLQVGNVRTLSAQCAQNRQSFVGIQLVSACLVGLVDLRNLVRGDREDAFPQDFSAALISVVGLAICVGHE
ncbi:MAG TPA: hypothetical protein VFS51_00165, partial [Gemmatimonadales bacterium]|nr:hypothetical protein [Gemmatimonadales bacterium]